MRDREEGLPDVSKMPDVPAETPTVSEPRPSQGQVNIEEAPVRVAIDISDALDGQARFFIQFMPDGIFDPTSNAHVLARDIQRYLNSMEANFQEQKRAYEKDLIKNAVLKVCDPVDGPLETMRGPSEATN